jgi:hypothetical protein
MTEPAVVRAAALAAVILEESFLAMTLTRQSFASAMSRAVLTTKKCQANQNMSLFAPWGISSACKSDPHSRYCSRSLCCRLVLDKHPCRCNAEGNKRARTALS